MEPLTVIAVVLVGLVFVVPLARGVVLAVREGDPWAPFERRHGRDGVLASGGRYFSALRAPGHGRRSRGGLVIRWTFWVGVTATMVLGVGRIIW